MLFIETQIFTKLVTKLLSDDRYRDLQNALRVCPEIGDMIPGSGGLRKMRWSLEGRGKRGGIRVIYYWRTRHDQILLLYLYKKNEQENLSSEQLKQLRKIVEEDYEKRLI